MPTESFYQNLQTGASVKASHQSSRRKCETAWAVADAKDAVRAKGDRQAGSRGGTDQGRLAESLP